MGKPTKQLNRQLGGWGKSTQWGKDKGKITVEKSEKVTGNYIFLLKIIHNVCVNVSIWDGNALSKSFRLCSKAPNSRHEKAPYKLLVKGVQDASKIVAYCCCFFFFFFVSQKLKENFFCWKYHAHRRQDPSWISPENSFGGIFESLKPSGGPAPMAPEGIMQVSNGKKQPTILLPSYNAYEPQWP